MYAHYTSDKIVTKTVYFDVTVFFVFKARLQRHNSTRSWVELRRYKRTFRRIRSLCHNESVHRRNLAHAVRR